MRFFCRIFICGIFLFPLLNAAEKLPEPVAWLGKMPLESVRFSGVKLPSDPAARREALAASVNTEAYVIIIKRLLTLSGITPDRKTAERYISFRKIQAGKNWNAGLEKQLNDLAGNSDFQLKSALFFTLFAAEPASVEPSMAEIENFFYRNRAGFKVSGQRSFSLFLAGTPENAEKAKALLHQGMNFTEVAGKFDPEGVRDRIPGNLLLEINRIGGTMKQGEWRELMHEGKVGFVLLKAVVPERLLSFEEVMPLIREELSGFKLKAALELYIQSELKKHPLKMNF